MKAKAKAKTKAATKWVKDHPKLVAGVGLLATAAAAYYGVPPEMSRPLLEGLCAGLGVC